MITMEMSIDKNQINDLIKGFSPSIARKSIRSAIGRTCTFGKKYLVNDVTTNYNISAPRVRKEISTKRTTQTNLEAKIIVTKKQLSFINFKAYQDDAGVKVPFAKTETYSYPHAFINRKDGKKFIAIRKTKKRYQVSGKPGRGPSIGTLVDRVSNRDKRNADLTNFFYRELQEQLAKRGESEVQLAELE